VGIGGVGNAGVGSGGEFWAVYQPAAGDGAVGPDRERQVSYRVRFRGRGELAVEDIRVAAVG
jgi:hypothetical protein